MNEHTQKGSLEVARLISTTSFDLREFNDFIKQLEQAPDDRENDSGRNEHSEVIRAGKTIESAFNIEQDWALAATMAFCGRTSPDMPERTSVTNETRAALK